MAGSAFNLSSGLGADGTSIRAIKQQASHGFSAGSVICYVLNQVDGSTGEFELANASGITSAEAVGIVESIDGAGNEFTVVYGGEINTQNFISVDGNSIASQGATQDVWFLDPTIAGGLTAHAPSASGQIIKPVLTLVSGFDDGDKGIVTNYLGTVIGGSNTVSLDSVHPVGEIIAFGGETNDIPAGWQLCDGSTVDAESYPTYYARIGTKYGYDVELNIVHGGVGMTAGDTAEQRFSSDDVESTVLKYTVDGSNAVVRLDPDVLRDSTFANSGLIGTDGDESNTDNQGYPHGYDYDSSKPLYYYATGADALQTYAVNSLTIKGVKTPNLQARVLLGAGDAQGTFDGYTAGQMSGAEDAVGVQVEAGVEDTWVYNASSAAAASIMQPYLASNFIIRIDDTAKAALVDGVNVSLADNGLTDHITDNVGNGDINVYDTEINEGVVANQYKPLRLFDNYPLKVDNFESKFRIVTSDSGNEGDVRVGIGLNNPSYDLHMRKDEAVRIVLQDQNGDEPTTSMFLQVSGDECYVQAHSNTNLNFRVNNKQVMKFNTQEGEDGTPDADSGKIEIGGMDTDMICPVDIDNKLTVGSGLELGDDALQVNKNITVSYTHLTLPTILRV